MSIRIRLILSYLAMLIVPLGLLFISVIVIGAAVFGDLRSVYTLDTKDQNLVGAILNEEGDISADIRIRIGNDPDSLRSMALIKQYDDRLSKINMGLIVQAQDKVLFASPRLDSAVVDSYKPSLSEGQGDDHHHWREGNKSWIETRQYEMTFKDGSKGTYSILMNLDFLDWFFTKFFKMFFITLLVILVLVNGALTYFVSRSIIRPLRSLQRATGEMKEGNLSYQVVPESRDEIGELAAAFEEMRIKLKESIDVQLQYEDNRKNLISNISHDLKTPVTAIKGYVEGIMDGVTDSPEKLDRYLKTIHNKAIQLDQLIDELFMFSKLDLKRLPFHFEPVDLRAFLQDCTDELQMDVEKRGMKLLYETPDLPQPAMVNADREKLKRVLVNVIENAVKYMDKQEGRVWLTLSGEAGVYRIVIKDNGPGIAPDALPHIFDRFYRADRARNANAGGSGLGLAIASHIMEEHDGSIRATSEPGLGTVIMITLKKRAEGGR